MCGESVHYINVSGQQEAAATLSPMKATRVDTD